MSSGSQASADFSVNIADPAGHIDAIMTAHGDQLSVQINGTNHWINVGGLSTHGMSPSLPDWHQHAHVTNLSQYGLTADNFHDVAQNLTENPAVIDWLNQEEGNGSWTLAFPVGFVDHWTDTTQGIVVNRTMQIHALDPGLVVRAVVRDGNDLLLVTIGVGNGFAPQANNFFAPFLWRGMDHHIANETLTELGFAPPEVPIDYRVAPCFAADTPIALTDGTAAAIEDIGAGDLVAAFDEREANGTGALVPARVTRLIPGVTTEWIVLEDGTRVTPGHRYLRPSSDARFQHDGTFAPIKDILADDGLVVDADGQPRRITGTLLRAEDTGSDATWITPDPVNVGGTLHQPAPVLGWRTYNFTVEGLHTYVADVGRREQRYHGSSQLPRKRSNDMVNDLKTNVLADKPLRYLAAGPEGRQARTM